MNKTQDMRKLLNEWSVALSGGIVQQPVIDMSNAIKETQNDMKEKQHLDESLGGYISGLFNNLKQATLNISLSEIDNNTKEDLLDKLKEFEDYYIGALEGSGLIGF